MSSLFADAMRAAIYCNASGFTTAYGELETQDQAEARRIATVAREGLCDNCLEWDDPFNCELKAGHAGDHQQADDFWEMRWREKP